MEYCNKILGWGHLSCYWLFVKKLLHITLKYENLTVSKYWILTAF